MKTKKNIFIGAHTSITPSILTGLQYITKIGGNVAQIFLGSNRSATLKTKTKLSPQDILDIKKYLQKENIKLIVHSIYLLNFAYFPPTSKRIKYMHDNLQHDLKYSALLNAKCVVLHFGFAKDLEKKQSLDIMIQNLNYIIKHMPKTITLALETSAGQGSQIGSTLDDLQYVWDRINHHNVGFCLDTAHLFVSGIDISTLNGIKTYLKDFDKKIGIKNIILFHINDSRYSLGSRHDEHRGLQNGQIFKDNEGMLSLKYMVNFCKKKKIPMILETHGAASEEKHNTTYENEIKLIQNLS